MSKSLRTPLHQQLQDSLITLRKSKNLTQADVASKLNRPQSFVAKYEGGERRLDVVEFVEVANALETDPSQLLADLIRLSTHNRSEKV
jgi:transcriptional regulator with XRE-family HTH domain